MTLTSLEDTRRRRYRVCAPSVVAESAARAPYLESKPRLTLCLEVSATDAMSVALGTCPSNLAAPLAVSAPLP